MCGFVGILKKNRNLAVTTNEISPLIATIKHRGPDDQGIYVDGNFGIGFARLSIIDLSEAGHQPMKSFDDRLIIAFNGEVYNFGELRESLTKENYPFKSRTDTEVVLNWFHFKREESLQDFNGMFAFAIWDRESKKLFLTRDRFGEKPLYLYEDAEKFIFASELMAIRAYPGVDRTLDPQAISDYLTFRYIPSPRTGYAKITKLNPATYVELSVDGVIKEQQYYEPNFVPSRRLKAMEDCKDLIHRELKRSVEYRLISDVPVGIFLSGGLDSSALVAIASELGHTDLKTFTIAGADAAQSDERQYAKLVANKFGTKHHEIEFSPQDLVSALEKVVYHLGEPVADMPSVALKFLSEAARREVTVVLSGEGSDEIFAGYSFEKYYFHHQYYTYFNDGINPTVGKALGKLRPHFYFDCLKHSSTEYLVAHLPAMVKSFNNGSVSKEELMDRDFSAAGHNSLSLLSDSYLASTHLPFLNRILKVHAEHWLADDLLARCDRMTMAHSLELRAPFLDHTLVDAVGSLPINMKIGKWKGKMVNRLILREIMSDLLPQEIIHREKAGFTLPLRQWAHGPLKGYFQEVFAEAPYPLNRDACLKVLKKYHESEGQFNREVWQLLLLIMWLRSNS